MRIHRLRVQAFGPFAGVEEVDVDTLCAGGLFLLHGATGAGKSSVLDAVCFALYGRVPGARAAGAPRLRSDHAAAGVPPEVLCEFSVAGRRFEVTRSPAWERPKKRGSGSTTEQARTLLRELVAGEWVARSSRNDEASQLLTDVLGMGLEQFTKVVLLPQGEFAAFLRCPAEERRPLLERLFGTDRFSAVERWLGEERRRLEQRVEAADVALTRLVAQAHQSVAGLAVPAGLLHDPAAATDVVGHLDVLLDSVRQVAGWCHDERDSAAARRADVLRERDEAARRTENLRRLAVALEEQRELEARGHQVEEVVEELAAARRADVVAGHLRALDHALVAERAAWTAVDSAQQGVDDTVGGDSIEELRRHADGARDEAARLTDLTEVEVEVDRLAEVVRGRFEEARALAAALEEHDQAAHVRSGRREELRAEADALTVAAGDVPAAQAALERARAVLDAAREAANLAGAVLVAEADATRARDEAQAARGRWLDLRERRLDGMAAELAASLEDGRPCPVCGSIEHPDRAAATAQPVSRQAEDEARSASEGADAALAAAEAAVAARREALAARLAASDGAGPEDARVRWEDARRRLDAAQEAARHLAVVETGLGELAAADEQAADRRVVLVEQLANVSAAASAGEQDVQRLRARLEGARGDDASVRARRDRLGRRARALEALVDARVAHAHATASRERAEHALSEACRDAGLADAVAARRAVRTADRIGALQATVDAHRDQLAGVRARLEDPELRAVSEHLGTLGTLEEQQARLAREVVEAEARLESATGAVALARRAMTSLEDLRAHAAAEAAAAEPLRARAAVVADLARCADGTGGDNALRMRLSAYVLAARLEQVAQAATVRLTGMSGGRYALVHSDAAERRGARSGLGLRVVDAWTGIERDTCTLSGGESFLASLALALGLADVVQAESGGAAIETLFVDEGFGSLDDETLEEVMTILDGLREGGRAVGLVSHVAELRNRIPARLEVVKTRTGSHLRTDRSPAAGAA